MLHVLPTKDLAKGINGMFVKVAGLVLVRQRPGTAKGVCFITIEDETGVANLVVFQNLFDQYRKEILQSKLLMVDGTLQVEGEVIHVIVTQCFDLSKLLRQLTTNQQENLPLLTLSRADERSAPVPANHKSQQRDAMPDKVFPGGRNFK